MQSMSSKEINLTQWNNQQNTKNTDSNSRGFVWPLAYANDLLTYHLAAENKGSAEAYTVLN